LQTGESLTWHDDQPDVVHFSRPGGWTSITNFGSAPVPLPQGRLAVTSGPTDGGLLPPETTAWLETPAAGHPATD
jgi:alpha-glucosidase